MSPVFRHGGLRLYLLKLLDEAPRHGYEVIRLLQDRFMGVYSPSPGTIYPRLARLEEEGLVTHDEVDGKKVYRITDKGREEIQARLDDLAELEEELTESVRDIAREVTEDVRDTVRNLREELTWMTRDVRRESRERARRTPGSGEGDARERARRARDEVRESARRARDEARQGAARAQAGAHGPEADVRDAARQAREALREQARQARDEARQGRGQREEARARPGRYPGDWADWASTQDWPNWTGWRGAARRAAVGRPRLARRPGPGRRPVPGPGTAGRRFRPGTAQGRLEHRIGRRERPQRPAVDPRGRAGQDQERGLRRRDGQARPRSTTKTTRRSTTVRLRRLLTRGASPAGGPTA